MGKVKIVSASAGSGKTYSLSYEYVRNVIENPTLYRHILAVTFTNKATEEMKQRILSKINDLASGNEREFLPDLQRDLGFSESHIEQRAKEARSRILHDYNHFSVLTIDKFFQRIIRSFIRELGVDLNFNLELPTETLLTGATDRLIDDITTDPALRQWLIAFINERIDDNRQWTVRGEIETLGREIFKEEYRRHNAGRSREELGQIVSAAQAEAEKCKSSIKSAAQAALELIHSNGLQVEDFAYGIKGAAGYVAKCSRGEVSSPNSYVAKALSNNSWYAGKSTKKAEIDTISSALAERVQTLVKKYEEGIKVINSAELIRRNYRSYALLTDLKTKIDELSREENILHISEINTMLSRLIADNDTPFIFEKAGSYFSHFMIDEFQDTSSLQWNNFIPLLQNAVSQDESTPVMLVGDVKQSIYRWRGGDWSILAGKAASEFSETVTTSLQDNYRSCRTIVEFNNEIMGSVVAADNTRINTVLDHSVKKGALSPELHGELHGLAARAYADYRQNPHPKRTEGYVTVTKYPKGEIAPVIEMVESLQRRGYSPREIAILVRSNSQGTQIANMLLEHKNTDPDSPYSYDVISQEALIIGKEPVCVFVVACMKLSSNPADTISRAIYNQRLSMDFGRELSDAEKKFFASLRLKSPEEAFEAIVIRFELSQNQKEVSYLQALHEQIISFTNSNIADIPLFVQWWDQTGSSKSIAVPPGGNAITIDTIHRSKGLGYKAVIIPYCNWPMTSKANSIIWASSHRHDADIFPVSYASAMADSVFSDDYYREYVMSHIDNLNLLYVALTRAKEELHIMMPALSEKRGNSELISMLISDSITANEQEAKVGTLPGKVRSAGANTVIEFGTPTIVEKTSQAADAFGEGLNLGFNTADAGSRIKVSLSSQRYFDDGAKDGRLSPRDYGILMHRAFEAAVTEADIHTNINSMTANGIISPAEASLLRKNIQEVLTDPRTREWFGEEWDMVMNESAIISPGQGNWRPDRVMIRDSRAVVVDYKFGLTESPAHRNQISHYMTLLKQMGYTDIQGYIWYVHLGRITEV